MAVVPRKSSPVPPPTRLALRILAGKVEQKTLSAYPDDTAVVAKILRALADGESSDAILGIPRLAHRPPDAGQRALRIAQIATLCLPKNLGGDGMTQKQAIEHFLSGCGIPELAVRGSMTVETLGKELRSELGRKIRADVLEAARKQVETGAI